MANGVSVLDPDFGLKAFDATAEEQAAIAQAQAAGQPQPRQRPPSLFDQTQVGLFSTGVADPSAAIRLEEELGFFGEGILGRRGPRIRGEAAQEQFDVAKEGFFDQVNAAGINLTPGDLEAIDTSLEGPGGFAGAEAIAAQRSAQQQFDLPLAVAGRERAVRAVGQEETKRVAAVDRALVADASARLDLARKEQEFKTLTVEQDFAQWERNRDKDIARAKTQDDFANSIRSNTAVVKLTNAMGAAAQTLNLLEIIEQGGDESKEARLALQTIATTYQLSLEPGLAVREEDKIGFNQQLFSAWEGIQNVADMMLAGTIDPRQASSIIRTSLGAIMQPNARRSREVIQFYQEEGRRRGIQPGTVLATLGWSQQMVAQLDLWDPLPIDPSTRPAPPTGLSIAPPPPPPAGVRRIQIRDQDQ